MLFDIRNKEEFEREYPVVEALFPDEKAVEDKKYTVSLLCNGTVVLYTDTPDATSDGEIILPKAFIPRSVSHHNLPDIRLVQVSGTVKIYDTILRAQLYHKVLFEFKVSEDILNILTLVFMYEDKE